MGASTTTSPTVLPEPEDVSRAKADVGNADDLIAQLADKQIDAMLKDADLTPDAASPDPEEAVEAALQAASGLSEAVNDLSTPTESEPGAEIGSAEPTTVIEPPAPVVESTIDASVIEESAETTEPSAVSAPKFDPPGQADIDRTKAAAEEVEDETRARARIAAEHAEEDSSADAVAAELAADAALSPLRPAAEPVMQPVAATSDDAKPGLRDWLFALPTSTLAAVNLPVRSLSDNGREVIGVIAIVTLANAAALLLYLMMFR